MYAVILRQSKQDTKGKHPKLRNGKYPRLYHAGDWMVFIPLVEIFFSLSLEVRPPGKLDRQFKLVKFLITRYESNRVVKLLFKIHTFFTLEINNDANILDGINTIN